MRKLTNRKDLQHQYPRENENSERCIQDLTILQHTSDPKVNPEAAKLSRSVDRLLKFQ